MPGYIAYSLPTTFISPRQLLNLTDVQIIVNAQ